MNYKEQYIKLKIKRFTDGLSALPFFGAMVFYSDTYLSNGLTFDYYTVSTSPLTTAFLIASGLAVAVGIIGYSVSYFYTCPPES